MMTNITKWTPEAIQARLSETFTLVGKGANFHLDLYRDGSITVLWRPSKDAKAEVIEYAALGERRGEKLP